MFYRILENRKILLYLALPDLEQETKKKFEEVLSKHGTYEFAEEDLIKFYSNKVFSKEDERTDYNIKKYVRKILSELGHADFR
ncbi:MAG: hypothetical protein NE327_18525 [Lentisphaeraceae bacterium]|nr:hypothetical protein [Lentisphaeraceae bacterium]